MSFTGFTPAAAEGADATAPGQVQSSSQAGEPGLGSPFVPAAGAAASTEGSAAGSGTTLALPGGSASGVADEAHVGSLPGPELGRRHATPRLAIVARDEVPTDARRAQLRVELDGALLELADSPREVCGRLTGKSKGRRPAQVARHSVAYGVARVTVRALLTNGGGVAHGNGSRETP